MLFPPFQVTRPPRQDSLAGFVDRVQHSDADGRQRRNLFSARLCTPWERAGYRNTTWCIPRSHKGHVDLPSIPWNHLPAVRQAAPELYDSMVFHTSWTKLLHRFLFDPSVTLFSRQVRELRGVIPLNAL